ncbi:unknown function [Klebsiella phage vB_Ko_K74PH129C2]|uniref:Uncharacterized protein n=1 Tax=Klebsiella phage vB_Ko_K74PH129C2 TaxID=3071637 RepID=A0AAV1ME45_9CAUD|nr:unknown function [Klebsiella phage vB_Ko_K74PH129C2]
MSLRIDTRHIKAAQLVMAYGTSDALTKCILTKRRKMTARQAACAVKWPDSRCSHTNNSPLTT